MFKINKLEDVSNEQVLITYVNQETYQVGKGTTDSFKTLSFEITGTLNNNTYSLSFDMNCKPEKLLEIDILDTVDFKKYLWSGETFLNINNLNGIEPEIEIKITRCLKTNFVFDIQFFTDNNYGGVIEFEFDLKDYL